MIARHGATLPCAKSETERPEHPMVNCMRSSLAIVLAIVLTGLPAWATDRQISSEDVLRLHGCDHAALFEAFGTPTEAWVVQRPTLTPDRDAIFLQFGPVYFELLGGKVASCWFSGQWAHPVYGVRLGDAAAAVRQTLGEPSRPSPKIPPSSETYEIPGQSSTMNVSYNHEGKVSKISVVKNLPK